MYENLPDLLTSDEVCEFLRVTPLSLYGYIKDGKLKAYRVGKRYRIPRDALIAFLEGQTATEHPAPPKPTAARASEPPQDVVADKLKEIFGRK
jgi:excisionase family DNA binding protein